MLFNLSISLVSSFSLIRSMAFSDSSSPTRSNMAVFFALRLARETCDATLFFCLRVSLVFLASGAPSPSPVSESKSKSLASRFRDLVVLGDSTEGSTTDSWSLEVDGEGEDSIKTSSQLELETEGGPTSIVEEEVEVASSCCVACVSITESCSDVMLSLSELVVVVLVVVGSKLKVSAQKVEKSMSRFSTSVASNEGGRREAF